MGKNVSRRNNFRTGLEHYEVARPKQIYVKQYHADIALMSSAVAEVPVPKNLSDVEGPSKTEAAAAILRASITSLNCIQTGTLQ